ncbi:integrase core domain-containing protein [Candidiatus Paracoxiella cheracis]|uniref:integrase core domain-containing protein n=1 Tax=Candidiatus Paracoxiella cheracis TaxID=3405120 RepID=UPI003BF528D9
MTARKDFLQSLTLGKKSEPTAEYAPSLRSPWRASYDVAFRKKIYRSLEELQQDVDAWIKTYNEVRPHSGERCYGKTPMQTFLDAKHLAQEKELDKLCKTIPSVSADELNKAHSNHDTQLVEE